MRQSKNNYNKSIWEIKIYNLVYDLCNSVQ